MQKESCLIEVGYRETYQWCQWRSIWMRVSWSSACLELRAVFLWLQPSDSTSLKYLCSSALLVEWFR